ncbi:MAG: hypothetical protein UIH27_19530 [Ruminococcus sp.]|nr:hypothetical protein [Ruminococcus sp.]
MALIPIAEWALSHKIAPVTARQKAQRGSIPAVKMGRDWFIEESTPNTDNRIKSGTYINWRGTTMKEIKVNVINELEKLTADYHSVQLRRAALNVGIKHLKTQDCHEILNAFTKAHPEFTVYKLDDNTNASFFCSAFVSDNETPPLEEAACV